MKTSDSIFSKPKKHPYELEIYHPEPPITGGIFDGPDDMELEIAVKAIFYPEELVFDEE